MRTDSRIKIRMVGLLAAFGLLAAANAHAADRYFTVYAKAGSLTINGTGGATLDAWGYTTVNGGGPVFPGPQLEVDEGDTVHITLVNNHSINHNLVVKGLSEGDTAAVAPSGSHTYTFPVSQGGVYVYRDTLNNEVNREMGMYGALVVRPSGGGQTAWSGGPAYDVERVWVVGDMDKPRWNDVAGSGGTPNTGVYRPNYFIINGQGGFDAMADPTTELLGYVGDVGLVRIVNGGLFDHSLHFHGAHITIIADDGVPRTGSREATTVNVPAGSSVDVLYDMNQTGTYPMHIHTAQMETANGVYLNGVATMINVQ